MKTICRSQKENISRLRARDTVFLRSPAERFSATLWENSTLRTEIDEFGLLGSENG